MDDGEKLLEMLSDLMAIASTQKNILTKKEVAYYLGADSLTEKNLGAVCQYLAENGVRVEGYTAVKPQPQAAQKKNPVEKEVSDAKPDDFALATKKEKLQSATTERQMTDAATSGDKFNQTFDTTSDRRTVNMRMYREEVKALPAGLNGQEKRIVDFLQGDNTLRNPIAERFLYRVQELARAYEKRAPLDEVIAEGNMGLLLALDDMQKNAGEYLLPEERLHAEKFFSALESRIAHAMEEYIDAVTATADREQMVVAQTNLLHEAKAYLKDELGREPTREELSAYTKIDGEEIQAILRLSKTEEK